MSGHSVVTCLGKVWSLVSPILLELNPCHQILQLAVGDILFLGVTTCSGAINQLTLCLSLTGFDYTINFSSALPA